MIRNPILPGFNPDPSIVRVGADYYIATSTFEWYPGVQIHHSTDLVNWTLVRRPLERASQLDMRGNPDSGGIWAPCLSYADGRFWLVYTDVKRLDGAFKDSHNYIVTAERIEDAWSDPVRVNSSGFDPSLFHDDDGRKWFVNMQWNHRPTGVNPAHAAFDGILLQEYDAEAGRLVGEVRNIFAGTDLGLTEAPHLFKYDGYYYLTTAEGGTGYQHAVTLARSRTLEGPYDVHPDKHVLTAKDAPDAPLQRCGHGQLVSTPEGKLYHTFLCGRPLQNGRCPLGRETGIEEVVWKDGWLYGVDGQVPRLVVPPPAGKVDRRQQQASHHDFTTADLPIDFQWLRTPDHDRLFAMTGKSLRLFGREALGSWFEQSLVARRQEHHKYRVETEVSFEPENYQQAAGLTTYYNGHKYHALLVTHDDKLGRILTVMSCPGDWPEGNIVFEGEPVSAPDGPLRLAVDVTAASQQFRALIDGTWVDIGPSLDASLISDEAGRGEHASFTGAFVGMFAFDQTGHGKPADFTEFVYDPT